MVKVHKADALLHFKAETTFGDGYVFAQPSEIDPLLGRFKGIVASSRKYIIVRLLPNTVFLHRT